jgi:hypothetical protein
VRAIARITNAIGHRAQRLSLGAIIKLNITQIVAGMLLANGLIGIKNKTADIGNKKSINWLSLLVMLIICYFSISQLA